MVNLQENCETLHYRIQHFWLLCCKNLKSYGKVHPLKNIYLSEIFMNGSSKRESVLNVLFFFLAYPCNHFKWFEKKRIKQFKLTRPATSHAHSAAFDFTVGRLRVSTDVACLIGLFVTSKSYFTFKPHHKKKKKKNVGLYRSNAHMNWMTVYLNKCTICFPSHRQTSSWLILTMTWFISIKYDCIIRKRQY